MEDNKLIKTIADVTKIHLEKFCKVHGYGLDACEMRSGKVYFKIRFKLKSEKYNREYVTIENEVEIKDVNISQIQKIIESIRTEIKSK